MRRLLLPFFILRLLLVLMPFLISASLTLLYPFRSFFLAMVFFIYFSVLLGKTIKSALTPPLVVETVRTPSLQLEEEIAKWNKLYEQQPTHRDVLINLSRLYSAQGDEKKAREFLLKARAVDPNSEVIE